MCTQTVDAPGQGEYRQNGDNRTSYGLTLHWGAEAAMLASLRAQWRDHGQPRPLRSADVAYEVILAGRDSNRYTRSFDTECLLVRAGVLSRNHNGEVFISHRSLATLGVEKVIVTLYPSPPHCVRERCGAQFKAFDPAQKDKVVCDSCVPAFRAEQQARRDREKARGGRG